MGREQTCARNKSEMEKHWKLKKCGFENPISCNIFVKTRMLLPYTKLDDVILRHRRHRRRLYTALFLACSSCNSLTYIKEKRFQTFIIIYIHF